MDDMYEPLDNLDIDNEFECLVYLHYSTECEYLETNEYHDQLPLNFD